MFRMFLRKGGWLVVLPLFIIVVSALNYREASSYSARLQAHGVNGTATITDRFEERRAFVPGTSDDPSTSYVLRFRYSTGSILAGDFKVRIAEQRVSKAFFDRLGVGDTTPIRFLPDDDRVFEIEPGAMMAEGSNVGMIGLVIGVTCLPLFLIIWRNAARAVRLRDTGGTSGSADVSRCPQEIESRRVTRHGRH